jgi:hypothetical protein
MSLSNAATGLLGIGLAGIGSGVQTTAAYQEAKAANAAAEWNAGMYENQALMSEALAGQAAAKGANELALLKMEGRKLIGGQRQQFANSGVALDKGSAVDLVAAQAGLNAYGESVQEYNTAMEEWRHKADATNYRQQAAFTRATKRNPALAAGTTLLGNTTSIVDRYTNYRLLNKAS